MAIQLNSKNLKDFRDTLAKWHVADFHSADLDITKSEYIKQRRTMIKTNNERIAKIDNGDATLGNKADILAQNEQFEREIKAESERVAKLKAECTKDLELGYELVSDAMVNAIIECALNPYSADAEQRFSDMLVMWFKSNGATDADTESVERYTRVAYGAIKVNSSKVKAMNSAHNGAEKGVKVKKIFLGAICDEPTMAKVLPIYKWENIIEKKTRK